MREQFEQAKREFREAWRVILYHNPSALSNPNCKRKFTKDLNALLEQHKEVILAGMYPKDFLLWFHDNAQIESREEMFLVYNEMRFYTLDEVFDFWERVQEKNKWIARQDKLKNVKK